MNIQRTLVLISSLVLAGATTTARAQFDETNNLFYHAQRSPQSNLLNPAFHPSRNSFYLALPGLDFQFGSPLAIKDIIHYDPALRASIISIDTIFRRLNEENRFRLGANVQILGIGLKARHLYLNANLRMVNHVSIGLPISTVNALLQGNVGDDGKIIKEYELLNGDIFSAQSYLEASIGGAYHIDKLNLTIGVHAKLLGGIASAQTDHTRVVLETETDAEDAAASKMTALMYYQIQAGSAVAYDSINGFDFANKSISDYMSGLLSNRGLAFDIGARWDMGPFSFSLAINDISAGIHWTNNTHTVVPKNGTVPIEFNGIDINNVIDHGSFNLDSIADYFKECVDGMMPRTVDTGDYWTAIPTKINLGASFNFLNRLRAGILFHGQVDRGIFSHSNPVSAAGIASNIANTFRWNTTLSLSANLFNWIELIVGSSIVYDGQSMDFFNPGAALSFSFATFLQAYAAADYVSSIYLTDSKAVSLKAGMNILLGRGGKTLPQLNPVETILTPNEE